MIRGPRIGVSGIVRTVVSARKLLVWWSFQLQIGRTLTRGDRSNLRCPATAGDRMKTSVHQDNHPYQKFLKEVKKCQDRVLKFGQIFAQLL
jgi:hypothetical protein